MAFKSTPQICKNITDDVNIICHLNILTDRFTLVSLDDKEELLLSVKFTDVSYISIDIHHSRLKFTAKNDMTIISEMRNIELAAKQIKKLIGGKHPDCVIKIDRVKHRNKERRKTKTKFFSNISKEAYLFFFLLFAIIAFFQMNFSLADL